VKSPVRSVARTPLFRTLAVALLLFSSFVSSVGAQSPKPLKPAPGPKGGVAADLAPSGGAGKTLRVATRLVEPFVVKDGDQLTGFSIDLWREIMREVNIEATYQINPNVKSLLSEVETGKADVGVAAISVTAERAERFDFSQPIYDSGLQIMVRSDSASGGGPDVMSLLKGFFSPELLSLFLVLLGVVVLVSHVIWLIERRHEDHGLVEHKGYFPGIAKATWWATGTLAGQADEMPRSVAGRGIALLMMFTSAVFIAYFTAAVTTALTVQQLNGAIKGPDDLPGKNVATTTGSTAATYLKAHGVKTTEVATIGDAYNLLETKKADAVVFDAPVLLYYSSDKGAGNGKVQVVGSVFKKESYGIAFPSNSPWRKPVNRALLTLRENGSYDQIHDKWFGKTE